MIEISRKSRPSGNVLKATLEREGFTGSLRFGYGENKRLAFEKMDEAGVPIPEQYGTHPTMFPCVGRPDYHAGGRGFWLCRTQSDVVRALQGTRRKRAATHFMEFIEADKEFRVHVVDGKSIKISEKVPINGVRGMRANHAYGYRAQYPHDFNHKKTLRKWAIAAVGALGLELGAVDVLWSEERGFVVLEVNSGPCLTDSKSDTLSRYVRAIMERGDDDDLPVHINASDHHRSSPVHRWPF